MLSKENILIKSKKKMKNNVHKNPNHKKIWGTVLTSDNVVILTLGQVLLPKIK